MKNFNLVLVLLGILFFSVLMVENIAYPMYVMVFISNEKSSFLVLFSTIIGIMLGWGLRGMLTGTGTSNDYDDEGDGF